MRQRRKGHKQGCPLLIARVQRHVTSRSMPQDQPQTISVTDLDIAQLADVKKQLEEVRVIETGAIIFSHLPHP